MIKLISLIIISLLAINVQGMFSDAHTKNYFCDINIFHKKSHLKMGIGKTMRFTGGKYKFL